MYIFIKTTEGKITQIELNPEMTIIKAKKIFNKKYGNKEN